jgi:hypothetical protein
LTFGKGTLSVSPVVVFIGFESRRMACPLSVVSTLTLFQNLGDTPGAEEEARFDGSSFVAVA